MLRSTERAGEETSDGSVQSSLGEGGLQTGGHGVQVLLGEPVFSHAEWKSNDVAFGEKPKEVWNSDSGKPLSEITESKSETVPNGKASNPRRCL